MTLLLNMLSVSDSLVFEYEENNWACFFTVKKAVLGGCPLGCRDMGYELSQLLHIRFGVP